MDLEVLGAGEESVAAREGAHEGFLPGVDPHVVDQLVLGLEGFLLPGAVLPVAGVVGDLRAADVVLGEVGHNLVEAIEHLVAHLLGVLVNPLTGHLCLHIHALPHVPADENINNDNPYYWSIRIR